MASLQKITPCLWFDDQAEEAASFYVSIFEDAEIVTVSRYGKEGFEIHGKPEGTALMVAFRLAGQSFTALNGGPQFTFTEAVSFMVTCETQAEVDHYWERLGEDGDPDAQRCGWLKDRYGLSWQIVPAILSTLMGDPDPAKSGRVMNALLQMKKLDIAALQRAHAGA